MQGQLSQYPLAELIREIAANGLSGALRLVRERAKVAIYFQDGQLVFAASNLRAHRLREVVKQGGLDDAQISDLAAITSDDELAEALIKSGRVTAETLAMIRSKQRSDVLRLALLWTDGTWEFDPRVRMADNVRVSVDVNRLLLECARHLPAEFVASRFRGTNGITYQAAGKDATNLLPVEASVFSRASTAVQLSELSGLGGASKEENLRAVYALSLSGLLQRSDWPGVLGAQPSNTLYQRSRPASPEAKGGNKAAEKIDESGDVQALFARLKSARDHYDVLDIARLSSAEVIKSAYHSLARRFHPDHFHKRDSALRTRVGSAFARIARAYETLSNNALRAAYDAKLNPKSAGADVKTVAAERPADSAGGGVKTVAAERPENSAGGGVKTAAAERPAKPAAERNEKPANAERAEASFRQGMAALQRNQRDQAIRLLAEAAMLAPREARYRANYGHALIGEANARRVAESELQAAISLEPNNASHRVMLAELYQALGLRRRAQGELERALTADPRNEAARALLARLRSNG
jgi:curved DNA-binding protein CbpA